METKPQSRVLIVDDMRVNRTILSSLLAANGVLSDLAESGEECLALCRENRYDLILLDHRMPNKDGIETFNEIRIRGMNMETPVIMLTANALNGASEEYRNLGFTDYLTKPVDSRELELSLRKYLPKEKVVII